MGCDAGSADGLYAWGNAVDQALGVADGRCPQLGSVVAAPRPVPTFKGEQVLQLAAAAVFSVALLADGEVLAWGSELLGSASVNDPQYLFPSGGGSPPKVVTALSAGWEHALLLMDDGTLRGFGRDTNGQLGGTDTDNSEPQPVGGLPPSGTTVKLMAAGAQHSLVITDDGRAYAFGLDDAAQLGNIVAASAANASCRVSPCQPEPTELAPGWIAAGSVTALAAGRYHSLALLSDGAVCAWGSNARGQLGDGSPLGNTTAGQTHPNPNPNPDPNPNPNPYP